MRQTVYCALLLFICSYAYGCTCDFSSVPQCQQMRAYKNGALFLGVVIDRRIEKIKLARTWVEEQVVTFSVQDGFVGITGKTATVRSYVAASMCGYPFKTGRTYFVAALGSQGSLYVDSCGMTQLAERATDSVQFLRSLRSHPEGALIFGTVKRYVGEPNFISPDNLPISGSTVSLTSETDDVHGQKKVTVDSSGWYDFSGLSDGTYRITATLPDGYMNVASHRVELLTDGCSQIDFRAHAVAVAVPRVVQKR